MVDNKYAQKVWDSHTNPPKWKVGDMVTIRKSFKGGFPNVKGITSSEWRASRDGIPHYTDLSYMIIAVDSKPIDQAYTYSKTAGGARYYRLLPIGLAVQFDVMECNLKKLLKKQVS